MRFNITALNRTTFLHFLEKYSIEQLTLIPKGFSNHILWNIGHVLVAEQLLLYGLSGVPLKIEASIVDKYKKGSQPNLNATKKEVEELISFIKSNINQTKNDYENGIFKNFNPYKTSAGFELNSIEDSVNFTPYHEGIHLGIILSLKKFI